ncbi:MAG: TRAP transporter large permease subunit [Treponema sp.]|nr:TRAP transporter large permease subunit [Treponema sp.]
MNIKIAAKVLSLEKIVCFSSLALLSLMPFIELVLRQFRLSITGIDSIIAYFFLVVGFFAAMLTAASGSHIAVTAVQYIKNDKVKKMLGFACTIVSIFILTVLFWNCISFIKYALMGRMIGFIPDRVFAVVMPLGFFVIAFRFAFKLQTNKERVFAFLAILTGCIGALPAIAKIIWGLDPELTPEPFFSIINFLYDTTLAFNVPLILLMIVLGLAGMPIFIVIGAIAMIMLKSTGSEPDVVSGQIFSALTDIDIVAIPLFTLTGFFLSESKAGERLVRTFKVFFGWLPGGIIIATVVICAFFSSFTGASGVTILALGGILFTILNKNKYPEKFSIGMLTSTGGIGIMFPPSLPIILVAASSNTILHFMNVPVEYSIIDYFIGALVPGIVLVAAMIITGFVLSSKIKLPVEKFNPKEAVESLKESFFEILLPVILIIGYFSGFLSLLQVSAVSVVYVVIIEVFVKKDINISDIGKVFAKAVPIIGGILAILAMAKALSYAFVDSGVPDNFTYWMQNAVKSKLLFLLILNVALLALGCVMDIFSAILVVFPLIVPLGHAYGINPVHLGIIFVMNLEVGYLTPPVGLNLFLSSYRFEQPFMRICRFIIPFLLVQFAVVLLITYAPWLTTFLLDLWK